MKIVVLGASGMIGSAMFRVLAEQRDLDVYGTLRRAEYRQYFKPEHRNNLLDGVDLANTDSILHFLARLKPNVVVNCVGLTKHLPQGNDPIPALTMNALLPHRLAEACTLLGSRLLHVSTDCVFSGRKGHYIETDETDALDVYGKTKALGEVTGDGVVTLRTSTIGHEFNSRYGLLEWFLSQTACRGYGHAIFSGLPSVCFAEIVRDFVLPNPELRGLYNVGAEPINKYDLLQLIAKVYGKEISIDLDNNFNIDRSLDSSLFMAATGYRPQSWPHLIETMNHYQFG